MNNYFGSLVLLVGHTADVKRPSELECERSQKLHDSVNDGQIAAGPDVRYGDFPHVVSGFSW